MKLPLWPIAALPLSSALLPPHQEPLSADLISSSISNSNLDLDLDLDSLTTSLASALHHTNANANANAQPSPLNHIPDKDKTDHPAKPKLPNHLLPPPFRHPPPPPYHRHPPSNKTLYDLITSDPDTTILSQLIHTDTQLIDLLNATTTNLTFFAPTDHAFRSLLHGHASSSPEEEEQHQQHHHPKRRTGRGPRPGQHPQSSDLIRTVLKYHIVPAVYTPAEIFLARVLPTLASLTQSQSQSQSQTQTQTQDLNSKPNPLSPDPQSPKHAKSNHAIHDHQIQCITTHRTKHSLALNGDIPLLTPEKRSLNGLLYHIDRVLFPASRSEDYAYSIS
ncbi:FAS1 domain-containing protein [Aspergillus heteromorphus CBS 117.55]|uniref:FAS1 domain-containing protein n=1 Tax=Aspergillus heteromorphus CBS 117.55 TaxID=1448321 RepID=A0A317UU22_9EURO|nr:FAS1 domain-containing protein [Aspergillus heteromorphus CBS 117.55]PWY64037.1 FAS1 domain-containing protein [Aspergillus heteromorphus CBS 117.55]